MEPSNQTFLKEFILVGFSQNMQLCVLLFVTLLPIYGFTLFANIFLIGTVLISPKLHLPMYYFLCHLSIIDVCFSSLCLPKVLIDALSRPRTISVQACVVQMNIGSFLGWGTQCLILAVMAYDRYVAICLPLYYKIIMNWKMCRNMTLFVWSGSLLMSIIPPISRPLVFCAENKLDHFTCEILAVLYLACGNVAFYQVAILFVGLITLVVPLVFIVVSYILIISSILKIRSAGGRYKVFSTCASHLTVVSLFYGTCITMYMGKTTSFSSNQKYISVVYGVANPVLNPLIYSLRNNEVKEAFQKIVNKKIFSKRNVLPPSPV
ncbi:unnamed protein product [Staurois parvus]|uniref:G-protein coupled receptors family 1 profile domain-containing protein n=1 Tax=Staurois parvus TaxID=386267 RepID=A0ABN9H2Y7_9NEOB|nr:unnamed protein product [Staurois parvus]